MKRTARWLAGGAGLLLLIGAPAQAAPGSNNGGDNGPKSSYIVVLRDSVSDPGAVAREQSANGKADVRHVYEVAIRGYAGEMTAGHAAAVARDPRVQFVQPDYEVRSTAQTVPTGVDRIDAEASSTLAGNGSGVVNTAVAVIDTGISTSHPDLNVGAGRNCIASFLSPNDDNGHGSHVAGTIAAKDDGNGVVGVAPGARVHPVKVLAATGDGLGSWTICGIDWVAANASRLGIKVASMSLSGGGSDDGNCGNSNNDAQHKAICNAVAKGITFVVAAGNENTDFRTSTPAAYDEVLTVTAVSDYDGKPGGTAAATCDTAADDSAASYSNYAAAGTSDVGHTIAAPGSCIQSTWTGSGYSSISGTSMATPHVSGAVALCIANGACAGATTPAQIIAKLRNDAASQAASFGFAGDPTRPVGSRYYGHLLRVAAY